MIIYQLSCMLVLLLLGRITHAHHTMQFTATDFVTWSVCLCLCTGHDQEPSKNCWTNGDAIWGVESWGPKEPSIRWGAHWRHLANMLDWSLQWLPYAAISVATCCRLFLAFRVLTLSVGQQKERPTCSEINSCGAPGSWALKVSRP